MEELAKVFLKCVKGENVDRNDEMILYNALAEIFGSDNILTEIDFESEEKYFGCAIFNNGKWKVYNLIGTGGVVIKYGKRYELRVKAG